MAQATRTNPIDDLIEDGSAAKRELAGGLLDSMPVESLAFPDSVQSVAKAYADSGMTARARVILQRALDRTAALGDSHANRIAVLRMMAESWQQDCNLLKSIAYLEQAAAGQKTARDLIETFQRLTDLYRALGRPEALSAILAKVRVLPNTGEYSIVNPLARFFERQGLVDDAVAVYRQDIDRAKDAHQRVVAFQALADLYWRQGRYSDAVAAFQRAIAAADAAELAPLRQGLATVLRRAGRTAEADRVYGDWLSADHGIEPLIGYAAHLGDTDRGGQAEDLLKQYQATHPGIEEGAADSLLFALSNAAVAAGAKERSAEYLRAARSIKDTVEFYEQAGPLSELQNANAAAGAGKTDDAFSLALQAIEAGFTAGDCDEFVSMVPMIASALATKKETGKAEQRYRRLFALAESKSRDTLTPLLDVAREYARFLISQPSRWSGVADAIARYRDLLTESHGAESGALEEVAWMRIDFETARETGRAAMAAAQELLSLQESLNGNTSQPYLLAIKRVAGVYEMNGDGARAMALHRQAVHIADLVYAAGDTRRGTVRIEAAFALARQGEFDEAERLAGEAVAIGQAARQPLDELFTGQLEQILDMRSARNDE